MLHSLNKDDTARGHFPTDVLSKTESITTNSVFYETLTSIDLNTMPSIIKNYRRAASGRMEEHDLLILISRKSDVYSSSRIIVVLVARKLIIHCTKVVE